VGKTGPVREVLVILLRKKSCPVGSKLYGDVTIGLASIVVLQIGFHVKYDRDEKGKSNYTSN
jgi:hypothetical protein